MPVSSSGTTLKQMHTSISKGEITEMLVDKESFGSEDSFLRDKKSVVDNQH